MPSESGLNKNLYGPVPTFHLSPHFLPLPPLPFIVMPYDHQFLEDMRLCLTLLCLRNAFTFVWIGSSPSTAQILTLVPSSEMPFIDDGPLPFRADPSTAFPQPPDLECISTIAYKLCFLLFFPLLEYTKCPRLGRLVYPAQV